MKDRRGQLQRRTVADGVGHPERAEAVTPRMIAIQVGPGESRTDQMASASTRAPKASNPDPAERVLHERIEEYADQLDQQQDR